MIEIWFTTKTAWLEHKRGGKMELSDKQLAKAYLTLCEQMTRKKRNTIVVEFHRNNLNPSIPHEVEIYLRDRVEHLAEKVPECKTVQGNANKFLNKENDPHAYMRMIEAKAEEKIEAPKNIPVVINRWAPQQDYHNPSDFRED